MKDLKYSPERLIREMMVYSGFTSGIGLMSGRTGTCVLFFLYSRYFDDREIEEYAEYLLDEIFIELDQAGFGFENGITGIAWSIDYLIAHGYVEGDSDEVLEDIDLALQNAPGFRNYVRFVLDITYIVNKTNYKSTSREMVKKHIALGAQTRNKAIMCRHNQYTVLLSCM